MNSENQENYTRYFVRRVTKDLIAQLIPSEPVNQADNSTWSHIQEGAAKIGLEVLDVLRAALFIKKLDVNTYPKSLKNSAFPNMYGFFVVTISQGKITVETDATLKTIQSGAEIFLVADLVGLPLARINGKVEKSIMDDAPGQASEANYAIDLWLDPGVTSWSSVPTNLESNDVERKKQNDQRVGRFIQSFMAGRNDLTIDEFCELAKLQLNSVINRTLTLSKLVNQETTDLAKVELQSNIVSLIGLGSSIHIRPGSRIYRHQITLDENTVEQAHEFTPSNYDSKIWRDDDTQAWKCSGCKTENDFSNAFCEECGTPRPSGVKEGNQQNRRLLSADGDQLVFDLSFVSYEQPQVNYDNVALKCLEVLRPFCRKFPISSIAEPSNLNNIATLLDREFGTGVFGALGEFSIIDVRGADSDWQLQTRAKIREQIRFIEGDKAELEVAMAGYALREAQLVSAKKNREVRALEAKEEFERQKLERDISLEGKSIESDQEVGEHRIDARKEIDIEKINREVERERRKLDREDFQDSVDLGRSDQLSQVEHEMGLEKSVLRHDIDKEQLLDEAQRIKNDKDLDFEEKAARLRAARSIDIAKQEQDLDLRKTQVEHDNQLRKLQMMAELDRQQKEQYRGMTPAQILAMQATSLAEGGAAAALEKLAGADAEKERELADEKSKLYERMLEMQASSEKNQLDIMKAAIDAQRDSTDKVLKAHEKSVDNSEKWNEKSIEAMSKVATAVANKSGKVEARLPSENATQIDCPECGAQIDKNSKFCGVCGTQIKA